MIVRMLKTAQSEAGPFLAGQKYNITNEKLAKQYCDCGAAVELKKSGQAVGEIETLESKIKKAVKELNAAKKKKQTKPQKVITEKLQTIVDDLEIEKLENNA